MGKVYDLSFAMYFLYTWCTRDAAIGLVVFQSAEILGSYVSQYISYASQLNNTSKPRRSGLRCTTSALLCTSCTLGIQENAAIVLVVLQSAEILGLIICLAIHFLCVTIE